MKFDHRVKFKGILYDAGQDVPMEDKKTENKANTKPQGVVEEKAEEILAKEESLAYTKTEINRMPIVELKRMAIENDIDDSLSGAEIKKALIDKFGL